MNDLALIISEQLPGALTTAEIDATMGYAAAEGAGDPRGLRVRLGVTSPDGAPPGAPQLCQRTRASSPPNLSSLADSGRKASTIGRRAAAIGYQHKMAGHEPQPAARP